jgi:phosphatidylglycerol:prolipoprotein diacylglycerol transferase
MIAMPIVHHPFEFSVGPVNLTGFGIAMMLAFGVAHWVSQVVLADRGDDPNVMNDVTFAALVGTIVGAKIYYAVLQHSVSALFSRGGLVFWGGFIGAVLACVLVIRWRRQPFLRIADGTAVGIAAGYAIGRTGCWAVGDDYGRVWNGWLAVSFPQGLPPTTVQVMNQEYHAGLPATLSPTDVVSVYPTQLLEVVLGLAMFAILWRLRATHRRAGWLFGMYCLLAGVERFVVEFFRAKSDLVGPFTSAQLVALAVAAVGVVLLASRRAPATSPDPALAVAR